MTSSIQSLLQRCEGNTRRWLEESVPRSFGMCAPLMSVNGEMSKEEIVKELEGNIPSTLEPPKFTTREEAYNRYLKGIALDRQYLEAETDRLNRMTSSLEELEALRTYANEHDQQLLSSVLEDTIEGLHKEVLNSSSTIALITKSLSRKFHYSEEEEKKFYEKELEDYKLKVANVTPDRAKPYKRYLSQLAEAYDGIKNGGRNVVEV